MWPRVATESDFSKKYAVYVAQKLATYGGVVTGSDVLLIGYCNSVATLYPTFYVYNFILSTAISSRFYLARIL